MPHGPKKRTKVQKVGYIVLSQNFIRADRQVDQDGRSIKEPRQDNGPHEQEAEDARNEAEAHGQGRAP